MGNSAWNSFAKAAHFADSLYDASFLWHADNGIKNIYIFTILNHDDEKLGTLHGDKVFMSINNKIIDDLRLFPYETQL